MRLGTGSCGLFEHYMVIVMAYHSTLADAGWNGVDLLKLEYQIKPS